LAGVADPREHRLVARNTATTSANKIHDDAVARRYGFAGGLVPGVDVYAALAHLPAAAWGLDWLARGTLSARFPAPVYEGDDVVVTARPGGERLALELRTGPGAAEGGGTLCATGEAHLPPPSAAAAAPAAGEWADVAPADEPPPASPESLAPGTALALAPHAFHAESAGAYLADVGETLPLFTEHRVAHPGWLLRDANRVLSSNVVLGPWIHVGSATTHHAVVADGALVAARATVAREWERKGHRFVELDVALLADGAVAARVAHTAIYRPRPADHAGGERS
jgi:acyl dehydratase